MRAMGDRSRRKEEKHLNKTNKKKKNRGQSNAARRQLCGYGKQKTGPFGKEAKRDISQGDPSSGKKAA